MLGRYITVYLRNVCGYLVDEINRDKFDVFTEYSNNNLVQSVDNIISTKHYDYIINCMGVTNKRDVTTSEMFVVNSYLPFILAVASKKYNTILIHPTTDCVYSGDKGMYCHTDIPDCNSDYGLSKCMGETVNLLGHTHVIRASIIGEGGVGSLVEWVRDNQGKAVNGYTNHFWNGITCLEYAKQIEKCIENGTKHFPCEIDFIRSSYRNGTRISKYDLVKEISDIYNFNVILKPFETLRSCDRTLSGRNTSDIVVQIKEMKEFGEKYY
jgi:dTDP-4-dehydrorhamnose reductase